MPANSRHCPAAYGYSFAAGSTEDGGGQPMFSRGDDQGEIR